MTDRELPREEWSRLANSSLGPFLAQFPDSVTILVVEDAAGVIVGHVAVLPMYHAECAWIAEPYRRTGVVARKLWKGIGRVLQSRGCTSAFMGAADAQMRSLLSKRGTKVPAEEYVICLQQ